MTDQPHTPHDDDDMEGLPLDLGLHLVARHADPMAVEREGGDNEGDLSYDPARTAEILAQYQEDTREEGQVTKGYHLALHLASGHKDKQAFFRTDEQNEDVHRALPAFMHQHADVQHRYERALGQKIEADLGDGTLLDWCPVPHPPHEIADLARMIGVMHDQAPGMSAGLIAVDLAWIKTAGWPLRRRLLAALLIAFPLSWPPSRYIDRRVRKLARR